VVAASDTDVERRGEAPSRRRTARVRRSSGPGGVGRRWLPYALLAAPLAVYGTFVLYPLATTVRLSFYEWDGLTTPTFNGLTNYVDLVRDDTFIGALVHNGAFLFFYTVVPVALALLLTVLLTQEGTVRGLGVYRVGLFVPQVMPMVVVGVVWRWMYSPVDGAINELLGLFGVEPIPFLGDVTTALPAVGLVASWVQYGFALVLFMAGVQGIDRTLYDAASVDGAGQWAKFRYVTLPGLRGPIVVATTVSMIAALRVFDLVFVMTRGGPARRTTVVAFEIYQRAFQLREVGGAAAAATVLVVLILVLSRFVLRFQEEPDA
jgi:raffinose/stachyose/melibiose transport system permease protein